MSHCSAASPILTSPHQLPSESTNDSPGRILYASGPPYWCFTLPPAYACVCVHLLSWKLCPRAAVPLKCVLWNPNVFIKKTHNIACLTTLLEFRRLRFPDARKTTADVFCEKIDFCVIFRRKVSIYGRIVSLN